MTFLKFTKRTCVAAALLLLLQPDRLTAQTDDDAIMMSKQNLCVGGSYSYSSWKNYWEGTLKRNNLNLGRVSTRMYGLMATYGITDKLNVIVGAPYVTTHASAGTLHGEKGVQDLSAWLKWDVVEKNLGKGVLSIYAIGGGSIPLTNYIADYLPLSIGLQSKTLSGRVMADYQVKNFFVTGLYTYTWRHNIKIDQNAYYTTELIESNQVEMPNMDAYMFRAGYRSDRWIIEGLYSGMVTLGGFDIRRNDMPFPSNRMNSTMAGAHVKYTFPWVKGLSVNAMAEYTLTGRNVGQATTYDGGVFYILDFTHKKKVSANATPKTN